MNPIKIKKTQYYVKEIQTLMLITHVNDNKITHYVV